MKLIIKEYLRTLKEKDELDLLLCDLLLLDGYKVHNLPKTGERQYGVDVLATKESKVFLFVIKQQDISRSVWNSSTDSVQQSLDDIRYVYLPSMLPKEWQMRELHIVVATNGYLRDAVRMNWIGYQNQNSVHCSRKLNYEFWNIDKFVELVEKYAFNEHLFSRSLHSDLRKALYFMDENDYNKKYFERIIDFYLEEINSVINHTNRFNKRISAFFMCLNLLIQYANEKDRYKISIMIMEYSIIKYWGIMLKSHLFEKGIYLTWLYKFLKLYEIANEKYYNNLRKISFIKYGVPFYNTIEHRIILYDALGHLTTYGLYLANKEYIKDSNEICDTIIMLLNSNQSYKYPIYDNNIIELTLLFQLLDKLGREDDIEKIIESLTNALIYNYYSSNKYPAPSDQYEEALLIEFQKNEKPYDVSIMFGGIIDWICKINSDELYNNITEFLTKSLPKVTIQLWQVDVCQEHFLFQKDALSKSGYCIALDCDYNISDMKVVLKQLNKTVKFDEFSFIKYSFPSLGFMISRYNKYPVIPQYWRE